MRTKTQYILLYLKGMAMGAADVVPGVSGGTIAFITGIYQELLDTIKGVRPEVLGVLKREGLKAAWNRINGNFLLVLLLGIFTSIISLAKGITYMLAEHPLLVWAFFFGLIIASTILIAKFIKEWNAWSVTTLITGAALAFYITVASPTEMTDRPLYIFLAGCVAICAMILPGISGSFILLLLGAYGIVLGSISGLVDGIRAMEVAAILDHGTSVVIFALGCLVGILAFSNFLSWLFRVAYSATMALLTGFMVGSLNKVWPWKETLSTRINSHGEEVPFLQGNVSPFRFEEITGEPSLLMWVIVSCVGGFLLVMVMERMAARA